jgi:hypothetical protein
VGSDPAAVAAYRRALARRGRWVIIRRVSGQAPAATTTDAVVLAIVDDYVTEASVMPVKREGSITQGGRKVIVLADDLSAQRFPLPIVKNDKMILLDDQQSFQGQKPRVVPGGKTVWEADALNLENPDPSKRAVAGAIELLAVGA